MKRYHMLSASPFRLRAAAARQQAHSERTSSRNLRKVAFAASSLRSVDALMLAMLRGRGVAGGGELLRDQPAARRSLARRMRELLSLQQSCSGNRRRSVTAGEDKALAFGDRYRVVASQGGQAAVIADVL